MNTSVVFNPETTVRKAAGHLAVEVNGEVLLMSITHARYLGLDDIGSDIWKRLENPQTVAELCQSLANDYAADPAVIEQDVTNLLMSLHGDGLLIPEA